MASIVTVKAPILRAIQAHAEFYPDKTWLYSFDYESENSLSNSLRHNNPKFTGGVQHGDELSYIFESPTMTSKLNPQDTAISKVMVELWTSFADTGVPKSKCISHWPTVTSN